MALPEWFIQFCYLYEYFKRSSAHRAHQNLNETIGLVTDDIARELASLNLETINLENDVNSPVEKMEPLKIRRLSDSDDSGIDDRPFEEDELRRVNLLYSKFGERELRSFPGRERLLWKDVARILEIRRIAFVPFAIHRLPHRAIEVFVRCKEIKFILSESDDLSQKDLKIIYKKDENGCRVICNNKESLIDGIKYQSLAAKELYFLIGGFSQSFTRLEIFNVRRESESFPSTTFYWKLQKYLAHCPHLIEINHFYMNFFEIPNHRTRNQSIVLAILRHLRIRKSATLRCLNEKPLVLSTEFLDCETWNWFPMLDILSEKILVDDYRLITGFKRVHMYLPENDMVRLLSAVDVQIPFSLETVPRERKYDRTWNILIQVQDNFNYDLAEEARGTTGFSGIEVLFDRQREIIEIRVNYTPALSKWCN